MSCRDAGRLMSLRLDRGASDEEVCRLDDHLAQCDRCRHVWESMREATAVLENKVMARPRPDFTAKVMQSVRQMPLPTAAIPMRAMELAGWLKIVLVLMAFGAIFVLTFVGVVGWLYASGYLSSLGFLPNVVGRVLEVVVGFGGDLAGSLWLAGSAVFEVMDKLMLAGIVVALLAMTLAWMRLVLAQGREGSSTRAASS